MGPENSPQGAVLRGKTKLFKASHAFCFSPTVQQHESLRAKGPEKGLKSDWPLEVHPKCVQPREPLGCPLPAKHPALAFENLMHLKGWTGADAPQTGRNTWVHHVTNQSFQSLGIWLSSTSQNFSIRES